MDYLHFMDFFSFGILIQIISSIPGAECNLWQQNSKPRMEISADDTRKWSKQFMGNGSSPDYFRLLERDGTSLLVGARNLVYNISLLTLREIQRLEWFSSSTDVGTCLTKGKNEEECQNYVRLLVKKSDTTLVICGTNAYSPLCREYSLNPADGKYVMDNEFRGYQSCPFDPKQSSTHLQADGELYVGTISDFASQDAMISRPRTQFRTPRDTAFFNEPNFAGSFSDGDFLYFLFREIALEYTNCGKAIYSRIARVCKNDKGSRSPARRTQWTSFLKSRLNCSIPGEFPFYFNEIQSVSPLMPNQIIYAVFTTPLNSISGSAVCAFTLSDVTRTFNGRFKEQKMNHYNWLPVSPLEVPEPRPGLCYNDSTTLPDQNINFIYSHTIMDETVPMMYGRPIQVYTNWKAKYTNIAVAPQVHGLDDGVYDVLFIGTNDGRVLKMIYLSSESSSGIESVVIEDVEVSSGNPVTNLMIADEQIIVVFQNALHALPLHRCHLAETCKECVGLRDPYCAWMDNKCAFASETGNNIVLKPGVGPIQNIKTGLDDRCPNDAAMMTTVSNYVSEGPKTVCRPCINQCPVCPTHPAQQSVNSLSTSKDGGHTHIPRPEDNEVPEFQTSSVDIGSLYREETLAVAVVLTLVLSLLVGFLIGYQVSRYRLSAFKESSLSESSDYSYGAPHRPGMDPRPPNDYRSEPIYAAAPTDFPPVKAINLVLNMQRNSLKNLPIPTLDSKPNPPSKKVYL